MNWEVDNHQSSHFLKQDCSFGTIAFLVSRYYGKVLGTESEEDV